MSTPLASGAKNDGVFSEKTPLFLNKEAASVSDATLSTYNSAASFSDGDPESQRQIPRVVYEEHKSESSFSLNESKNEEENHEGVASGIVDEVHEAADAFMEELHEADDGEMFFIEMGLTRNCSILPGDVARVAGLADDEPQDGELKSIVASDDTTSKATATSKIPISAYILLALAIISLSSIGPLLQIQHDVSPTMKIYWRMAMTAILLFPLAAREIYTVGFPRLTFPQWCTFLTATASYDVFCVAFVVSLNYTAVGNAVVLSNSLSLILLVGKVFVGDPVTLLEGSGAMVAFSGAVLCSKDSAEGSAHSGTEAVLGDLIALLSAIGGVGYLVTAKVSRTHMPLYTFMFLTMTVGCVMILLFQLFALREVVTFDMDYQHGIWGFLNANEPDRLPLEVLMALMCNCLGTLGYVRAMQYFDSLVISSAALLEPVVAEFIALGLGVGVLPGWKGWLGNLLVALGTYAVVYPSSKNDKGETKEATSKGEQDGDSIGTATFSDDGFGKESFV